MAYLCRPAHANRALNQPLNPPNQHIKWEEMLSIDVVEGI